MTGQHAQFLEHARGGDECGSVHIDGSLRHGGDQKRVERRSVRLSLLGLMLLLLLLLLLLLECALLLVCAIVCAMRHVQNAREQREAHIELGRVNRTQRVGARVGRTQQC